MLKRLLTSDVIQFHSHVKNWQEAIRFASSPLLSNGSITENYIEAMIQNVHKFGAYIVLMPKIAMPHARPEDGVKKVGMSLLVMENAVPFDGDKEANVFFVLAANDSDAHLQLLTELSTLLSQPQFVEQLVSVKNYDEFVHLLQEETK